MIIGAVTWSDVAVAGAFVAGAILGAIMAIRVMRYILEYMHNKDKEE
jgi:hypothetical protein